MPIYAIFLQQGESSACTFAQSGQLLFRYLDEHASCYVPGVTRKELGNQIMTNYYSQESQQQALLKFNNLLRNDKIINYQKQCKICTIKESLVYSTLILSPNCPSELTHTNPSTVSDPQISKSYYNFK